jgi:hydrogenase 3 maturation protease
MEELEGWLNGHGVLVIVGVGNTLKRDDGVGIRVIEEISANTEGVKAINAGIAPENCLGEVEREAPSHILFIDAVDAKEVLLLKKEHISSGMLTTHTISMAFLMDVLEKGTNAEVRLLGIPVEDIGWGEELTEKTERIKEETVNTILDFFKR